MSVFCNIHTQSKKEAQKTVWWIAAVQWPSVVHKSSAQTDCKLPCCHDKDTVINASATDQGGTQVTLYGTLRCYIFLTSQLKAKRSLVNITQN